MSTAAQGAGRAASEFDPVAAAKEALIAAAIAFALALTIIGMRTVGVPDGLDIEFRWNTVAIAVGLVFFGRLGLALLRQTIQKQCRFLAWWAVFQRLDRMGPLRVLMMRSQTVNPASSAILMKSQCAHRDRWLLTISVIFASKIPSGFSTRLACSRNGGYK